jgi:predicted RNase H-like HicB family nuclease
MAHFSLGQSTQHGSKRARACCDTISVMKFRIETEREVDGRWIAEVPSLPGVMAYGPTRKEAIAKVEALALRVVADQIERDKKPAEEPSFSFICL